MCAYVLRYIKAYMDRYMNADTATLIEIQTYRHTYCTGAVCIYKLLMLVVMKYKYWQ